MTREAFALLCAAFVVLVVGVAALGIWRRRRRQRDIEPPVAWTSAGPTLVAEALYVATSRAGNAYDRVFAHGLGFRGRTDVSIDADGVQFVADRREVRIPARRIRSVERATWTIDRVVEPGGIVVVTHDLGAPVDTYFRFVGDDREVFAALQALVPYPGAEQQEGPGTTQRDTPNEQTTRDASA